jgi:hypothetical protein
MRIGFFCESPADQAALAVFTEGLLGSPPEPIGMDLEAHGVSGVLRAIDGVFRGVHFNPNADGLVVVVDCDDTVPHAITHDAPGSAEDRCRYCQLRKIIDRAKQQVKPIQGRPALKVAIGLAVPAIEAWYLAGNNHQVGEPARAVGVANGRPPFTRPQLKKLVYGTDRPSVELQTERAVTESRRIIQDLSAVETAFPSGFGLMAKEIRSWRVQ